MQRSRSKYRPGLVGRSRSANGIRGTTPLQSQPTGNTTDARIAASRAFVDNQGRYNINTAPMIAGGTQPRTLDLPIRVRQPQTGDQQTRGSIRFVNNRSSSANDCRSESTYMRLPSTPGLFETPQRGAAKSGNETDLKNTGPSESNYSRYTSSLPNTPSYNRKNINKTWSGPQSRRKENPKELMSAGRGRGAVHYNTAPRRTLLSQRHWNRPPSRSRAGTSSGTTSSFGGGSMRKTQGNIGSSAKAYGPADLDGTNVFVGTVLTSPQPDKTLLAPSSRSYLRASRKRSFSFSSNDDERYFMPHTSTPRTSVSRPQPASLRSQRNGEKGMRKSLRQSRPETQRPTILPLNESQTPSAAVIAAAIQMSENGYEYTANSGSLRRSASRMSRRVRSKLKGF